MEALAVTELVKTFGSGTKAVHALQGVSLSVSDGEIFSLLGPNGAGKTTLIKCVLGVVFATGGTGTLLNKPLGSVAAKERIGYLPENHRYPLHLTGEQVLSYFGKLSGLDSSLLKRRMEETLKLVGMWDWRATKVRKYSKGMMQRLGLAQALINDPEVIILDEPTDGVDPVGRKEIRDVLVHLRDAGKTIFLNSHLLSEVERISDRVAIMDHGKLIRQGTVHELVSTPDRYEIRVPTDSLATAKTALGVDVLSATENALEGSYHTLAELNSAIDKLRAAQVLIESISVKKETLEELFIQLVQSSDLKKQ